MNRGRGNHDPFTHILSRTVFPDDRLKAVAFGLGQPCRPLLRLTARRDEPKVRDLRGRSGSRLWRGSEKGTPHVARPEVILFDVNETLLDLQHMKDGIGKLLGAGPDAARLWFTTMLQYSLDDGG